MEEWFRTTLYSIGDAVITTDARGRVQQMNPVAEKLTGWTEAEARGKTLSSVFKIINEETRKKVENPVARVLREGIVIGLANHTLLISRNGKEYPIADAAAPIRGNDGKVVGVVLVFRDQTAERKAQRAVQDARDFAESIIATIREPLLVLNDKLEVVSANRSFLRTFQVTPEETLGRKVYDLGNRQWDIPRLRTLLEDILPSNSHFDNFEVTHTFERIGPRTMLLNARRMVREENRSQLILLAIEDITERKRAEEEHHEAEQRNRIIAEMIPDYAYIFRVTPEGELIGEWVTDSFTKVFGYTLQQAQERGGWKTLVHPDDRSIAFAHAQKVAKGETDVCEMRWITASGDVRWLRDYAKPIFDETGKRVVRIYGASQDITERKNAEQEIREREEWFRRLADTTSTAIFIYQGEKFVYVNRACELLSGYSREELLNMKFWDVVHPDYADLVQERELARQRGEHIPNRYEFTIVRKDGTVRWVDFTVGIIDWQKAPAAIGTAVDITDRKKAEEELQRSYARYEAFFMEDLTGDYVSTPEGQLLACNPAFLRIFGFASKEEAFASNLASLFRSPEECQKLLARIQQEKKLEYYDLQMVKRDGSPLYLIGNLIGRFNAEGRLTEIQGYLFDDTKRRQLEEALRQAQKLEGIGTLASGIAHDFNNILAIILGHATILERTQHDPKKLDQSIKAITNATQRGASLVKQLLTFARKAESVFEPLDVNLIVKELARMFYETFPKTITIQQNIDPQLPPIIADATQIHQVLLNLCVNACDAMPKGGTLTISTGQIDGSHLPKHYRANAPRYVVLSVSDTGIGMDDHTRARIFEPFFTTKPPGHGTGLGLAVVHGILGTHNGYIDVESQPGKGSTFRIYLPTAETLKGDYEPATASATDLPGGTETILIAEDEEPLRQVLENVLTSRGYTVLVAEDGQQALELYRSRMSEIALVISDIGLPRLGGAELLREIKKIHPHAKVVLASGFIDPEMKSEMLASGVVDLIVKPYTINDVLLKIRKALHSRTDL